jgi:cell wall-associated NlpC family hydrolase
MKSAELKTIFLIFISVALASCATRSTRMESAHPAAPPKTIELMGYTIQAGAFAKVENAAHFAEILKTKGIEATYFVATDGFFKVRFGNYSTKEMARQKAQSLRDAGVIEEFYIVRPEDYAVARERRYGPDYLREALVKTAHDFVGVPYLWGGTSLDKGFDCSGLTMTVYQLNGLNLPRQSIKQFESGSAVDRDHLQKGDLVFFKINSDNKISHVGIYTGDGRFIHAPSPGKKIREESLASPYFARRLIGGRNYL